MRAAIGVRHRSLAEMMLTDKSDVSCLNCQVGAVETRIKPEGLEGVYNVYSLASLLS